MGVAPSQHKGATPKLKPERPYHSIEVPSHRVDL